MNDLEAVGDGIWLVEGGNVDFYGFPYSTRMVIVRLSSGLLWVWSPIALSENLRRQVDELGRVAHLVSPNRIHHLYLADWKVLYPAARLWGPASTISKRSDLVFEAPLTDQSPADWADEIDQFHFTGSLALDEVVFFHRLSRTAILADLSENFSAAFLEAHWSPWKRTIARIWKIMEPWGLAPLELRLSWFKRTAAREARDRLLAQSPDKVIMAHGEWQRTDGRAYLERVFAWLG
jgi:hypothetical protein